MPLMRSGLLEFDLAALWERSDAWAKDLFLLSLLSFLFMLPGTLKFLAEFSFICVSYACKLVLRSYWKSRCGWSSCWNASGDDSVMNSLAFLKLKLYFFISGSSCFDSVLTCIELLMSFICYSCFLWWVYPIEFTGWGKSWDGATFESLKSTAEAWPEMSTQLLMS